MKRRQLRSTANSLAQKVAGAAEHMAWMAWLNQVRIVSLDVLEAKYAPEVFNIRRNLILARYSRNFIERENENLNPPARIEKAVLVIDFAVDNVWFDKVSRKPRMGKTVFTAQIIDENGKVWRGEHVLDPMVISLQSQYQGK